MRPPYPPDVPEEAASLGHVGHGSHDPPRGDRVGKKRSATRHLVPVPAPTNAHRDRGAAISLHCCSTANTPAAPCGASGDHREEPAAPAPRLARRKPSTPSARLELGAVRVEHVRLGVHRDTTRAPSARCRDEPSRHHGRPRQCVQWSQITGGRSMAHHRGGLAVPGPTALGRRAPHPVARLRPHATGGRRGAGGRSAPASSVVVGAAIVSPAPHTRARTVQAAGG